MNLLNPKQITNLIKTAVDNKRPLSLTRLGDGEYTVIRYPRSVKKRLFLARIGRWFDVKNLSNEQTKSIRNNIYINKYIYTN